MDANKARARLRTEHAEITALLQDTEQAGEEDREAEAEGEVGDSVDSAQPLAAQGIDDAVAVTLRERLDAVERALKRLDDGTYGRSVRSGLPIPAGRLEADPAAELTVEEAAAGS